MLKFQMVEENSLPKDMPWGGYDFEKPTLAVIASADGNEGSVGEGAVLWSVGPHIRMEEEEVGLHTLEELGLQPESGGIWIWEGRGVWYDGPYEYPQDGENVLEGTFRRPTDEEWEAIRRSECPWNDDDWLHPQYKDRILAARDAPSTDV